MLSGTHFLSTSWPLASPDLNAFTAHDLRRKGKNSLSSNYINLLKNIEAFLNPFSHPWIKWCSQWKKGLLMVNTAHMSIHIKFETRGEIFDCQPCQMRERQKIKGKKMSNLWKRRKEIECRDKLKTLIDGIISQDIITSDAWIQWTGEY